MSGFAAPQQGVIFINYRRTDAGWPADLIATALKSRFGEGRVFQDVRDIAAGDAFGSVLEEQFRKTAVLLVLVGPGWLRAQDEFGRRRLDEVSDWVRREIREALEKPQCRVIPILLGDATLPHQDDALPADIAALLQRQQFKLRQGSEQDIDALTATIEQIGFKRVDQHPTRAKGVRIYADPLINDVVARLWTLRDERGVEFLDADDLMPELDLLFNRKTFRFESLRRCPEQRWGDRLDSAYQTLQVLRDFTRDTMKSPKYQEYRDLLREVDLYCMEMGALLFDPSVDFERIREHIGRPTFKDQLPKAILFPKGISNDPIIPDEINNRIEAHRTGAITLMDQLLQRG
jgi:hypothetical protein